MNFLDEPVPAVNPEDQDGKELMLRIAAAENLCDVRALYNEVDILFLRRSFEYLDRMRTRADSNVTLVDAALAVVGLNSRTVLESDAQRLAVLPL